MLLAGDKRLLREGNDVALLSNQKENYEMLNLIVSGLNACVSHPDLQRDAHES